MTSSEGVVVCCFTDSLPSTWIGVLSSPPAQLPPATTGLHGGVPSGTRGFLLCFFMRKARGILPLPCPTVFPIPSRGNPKTYPFSPSATSIRVNLCVIPVKCRQRLRARCRARQIKSGVPSKGPWVNLAQRQRQMRACYLRTVLTANVDHCAG